MTFSLWSPKSSPKFLSNGSCSAIKISHRLLCIFIRLRLKHFKMPLLIVQHGLSGPFNWVDAEPAEADSIWEIEEFLTKRTWRKEETLSYVKAWYAASGKRIIRDSGKTVTQVDSWGKLEQVISEKTLSEHLLVLGFSGHLPSGTQKDHTQLGAVTQRALFILLLSFSKTLWLSLEKEGILYYQIASEKKHAFFI